MAKVKCPTCGKTSQWSSDNEFRPFCSRRCRLIDLGAWLDGSNHIPGPELDEEQLIQLNAPARPANEDPDGY